MAIIETNFFSIEEFMILPDQVGRQITTLMYGASWLALYKIAKISYETYGDDGPPIGSNVVTLRAGFSGRGNDVRVTSLFEENNKYILLIDPKNNDNAGISYRKTWWRDFMVMSDEKETAYAQRNLIHKMLTGNL